MLPSFARETVGIQRAETVTERGTARADWDAMTDTPLDGCLFQPGTSTETGVVTLDTGTLFAPAGADIRSTDRIRTDQGVYTVDGNPIRISSPSGRLSHTLANLKRFRG